MGCRVCHSTDEEVKITEYFNCYPVALCTACYAAWVIHYYQTEDFRKLRDLILRARTLEAYMANHWTEERLTEFLAIDKQITEMELKMAKMAEIYFRARE